MCPDPTEMQPGAQWRQHCSESARIACVLDQEQGSEGDRGTKGEGVMHMAWKGTTGGPGVRGGPLPVLLCVKKHISGGWEAILR